MKGFWSIFLLCFLVLFTLPVRAESITIVADIWCPYNCEPGTERPGYMIEIAKEAFAKHGIDVAYFNVPWARAIEDARIGKYSAIVGAFKSDAPDFIYPEMPLGRSGSAFFIKKGNKWRYNGVSSLAQTSIGTIADYSYGEEFDKYIEENKSATGLVQVISGDNALEINVKKLLSGRIGTVIEDSFVMQHFLLSYPEWSRQIESGGDYEEVDYVYIGFSPVNPNSKRYAEILSTEIKNMRLTGRIDAIMQQYGLEDFDESKSESSASGTD